MSKILIIAIIAIVAVISYLFGKKGVNAVEEEEGKLDDLAIKLDIERYKPEEINVDLDSLNVIDVRPKPIEDIINDIFVQKYITSYKTFCDYKIMKYSKLTRKLTNLIKAGPFQGENPKSIIDANTAKWQTRKETFDTTTALENIKKMLYMEEMGILHIRADRPDVANAMESMFISFVNNPTGFSRFGNNFLIVGSNGVGKTTSAEIITMFMYNMGVSLRPTMTPLDSSESGSSYKDGDVQNIRNAYIRSMDCVVFIDEIYSFAGETVLGEKTRSGALACLLLWMSKLKGITTTMGAGYEDKINDELFAHNQGVKRRFNRIINIKDQDNEVLSKILCSILCRTYEIEITDEQSCLIYTILGMYKRDHSSRFESNASDMENVAECFSTCMDVDDIEWGKDFKQDTAIINTMFSLYVNGN